MNPDNTGLNRGTLILLIFNALLGLAYTSLPNTYLEKSEAKELLFIIGLGAALISGLAVLYGRLHAKKQKTAAPAGWETGLQWFLPVFFTVMCAVIGSRAVIIYLGYQAPAQSADAQILEIAGDKTWWTLKIGAPLFQTVTFGASPALLAPLHAGEAIKLEYRETPYSYNFTGMNSYFGVSPAAAK